MALPPPAPRANLCACGSCSFSWARSSWSTLLFCSSSRLAPPSRRPPTRSTSASCSTSADSATSRSTTAPIAARQRAEKELGARHPPDRARRRHRPRSRPCACSPPNTWISSIGVGFIFTDDITQLAKEYPNTNFAGVDYSLSTDKAGNPIPPPPNVAALKFKEEEGSFLVGALAALVGNSKKVGFVGGMDVPLIQKFEAGYKAGVKYVCPDCTVIAQYAGVTPEAFRNPGKGKELALNQYQQGVNVIYHASGSTGLGVFEAARQTGKYAIGVDADQYGEAPGRILTSMVKGIDVAVFDMIKRVKDHTFKGGDLHLRPRAERRRLRVRRAQSRAHSRQRARAARADQGRHHRRQDHRAEYEMSMADSGRQSPAIRLTDIHKSFGPVLANRGASLEVARGEIHALVGENGAGKSTLMRVLSGMYVARSGRMEVNGRDVTGWSTADAIDAGVGMVHQHFMLVPTLTVAENVMLGRELTKGGQLDRARAEREVDGAQSHDGTRRAPGAQSRRPFRRRSAARRDSQDAVSRREDSHSRRADGRALAARDRRALAGAAADARSRRDDRAHHAQARRSDGDLRHDHRDAPRPHRRVACAPSDTTPAEIAKAMVGRDVQLAMDYVAEETSSVAVGRARIPSRPATPLLDVRDLVVDNVAAAHRGRTA